MSKDTSTETISNIDEMYQYRRGVRKIRAIQDLPNSSQDAIWALLEFSKVYVAGSSVETTAELLELRKSIPDVDLRIWIDRVAEASEKVIRGNITQWLPFLSDEAVIKIRTKNPFVINIEDPIGWDISIYDENKRKEPFITPDNHLSWLSNRDKKVQIHKNGTVHAVANEGFNEYLRLVSAHFDRRMFGLLMNNLSNVCGNDFLIHNQGKILHLSSDLLSTYNCLVINPDARDLISRLSFDVATKNATLAEVQNSLSLIAFDSVYFNAQNSPVRLATNPVKLFFKEALINDYYLSDIDKFSDSIKLLSKSKLAKFVKRHELSGDIAQNYLEILENILSFENYYYAQEDLKLRDIFVGVIRDLRQQLTPDAISESESIVLMSLEDRLSTNLRRFVKELGVIKQDVEKIKQDYEEKKEELKSRKLRVEDQKREINEKIAMQEQDKLSKEAIVEPLKIQELRASVSKDIHVKTADIRKREKARDKKLLKRAKTKKKIKIQAERNIETLTSDEAKEFSLLAALMKEISLDNVEDIKGIIKRNPSFVNVRMKRNGFLLEAINYNKDSSEEILLDVVRTFIDAGVNLNMVSQDMNDTLTSAIKIYNVALVKLLINAGARVDKSYNNNNSLLHIIVEIAKRDKMEDFCEVVKAPQKDRMDDMSEIARLLIDKGADPSRIDKFGNVAADYAESFSLNKLNMVLAKKNGEIVTKEGENWKRELLPADSEFFIPILSGFKLLELDRQIVDNSRKNIISSNLNIFKEFIKNCYALNVLEISKALRFYPKFATLNLPNISPPIFYVSEALVGSEEEKLEALKIFINNGVNLSIIRDVKGNSILHCAAYNSSSALLVKKIIEIAPDLVNVENSYEYPPLLDALIPLLSKRNGLEIAQIFLEKSNKKLSKFKDVLTGVFSTICLLDESEYLNLSDFKGLVLHYKEYIDFSKVLGSIIANDDLDFVDRTSFKVVENIRIRALEQLRDNGVSTFGYTDENGYNSADRALLCGYYKMSAILMKEELKLSGDSVLKVIDNTSQGVIDACLNGDVAFIQKEINENIALLNIEDEITGETLIHYACLGGNIDVFDFLVESGLNINAKTKKGFSPFLLLCNTGNIALADHVFSRYNIDLQDVVFGEYSALVFLCGYNYLGSEFEKDRLNLVEKIITQSPNLMNQSCQIGYPLSIIASSSSKYELLELFLQNNVLGEGNSSVGNLALSKVCLDANSINREDKEKQIELLIRYGVDPNITDEKANKEVNNIDFWSFIESKMQDYQKGKLLPPAYVINNQLFADLEFDSEKMTSQDRGKYEELIISLREAGRINSADSNGKTLLHYSCENKNQHLTKILLENGSNPMVCNAQNKTVLSVALQDKNDEFADFFRKCYREQVKGISKKPSSETSSKSVERFYVSEKAKDNS